MNVSMTGPKAPDREDFVLRCLEELIRVSKIGCQGKASHSI